MKKLLSGFCALALVATFATACTESKSDRVGEGPSDRDSAASPSTSAPATSPTMPPAAGASGGQK